MPTQIDQHPTQEQLTAATTAASALNNALSFLVALDVDERIKMLKMGDRTDGFVRYALNAAREHPGTLPGLLDVDKLERDLDLRDDLAPLEMLLASMLQKVQDTRRVAGRDLYSGCLDIYQSLQRYGGTEGVDATVAQLGKRFNRGPRDAKDGDAAPAQR